MAELKYRATANAVRGAKISAHDYGRRIGENLKMLDFAEGDWACLTLSRM